MDGEGFVAGVLKEGHSLKGKRVLLAGAGGAACQIAFALGRAGVAELALSNRSAHKAEELQDRVSEAYPSVAVFSSRPPAPPPLGPGWGAGLVRGHGHGR